jgi:hypothetical protein
MSVPIEKNAVESDTPANSLENKSPPEVNKEGAEGARTSPSNIFPLCEAKTAVKRGRSAK